jgi:hypothetical protein
VLPTHGHAGHAYARDRRHSGDAASDDAGVGGYGFFADQPDIIYIVSEFWPQPIREALASAARTRAVRATDSTRPPMLAVPTAESFGMAAVPRAIAALLIRGAVARVIAIGDCKPASLAFEKGSSKSAQIRSMLRAAMDLTPTWLPVDVPREYNTDPDRLSHPESVASVAEDARRLGLRVVRARIPQDMWDLLQATTLLALAGERQLASGDADTDLREGAAERAAARHRQPPPR